MANKTSNYVWLTRTIEEDGRVIKTDDMMISNEADAFKAIEPEYWQRELVVSFSHSGKTPINIEVAQRLVDGTYDPDGVVLRVNLEHNLPFPSEDQLIVLKDADKIMSVWRFEGLKKMEILRSYAKGYYALYRAIRDIPAFSEDISEEWEAKIEKACGTSKRIRAEYKIEEEREAAQKRKDEKNKKAFAGATAHIKEVDYTDIMKDAKFDPEKIEKYDRFENASDCPTSWTKIMRNRCVNVSSHSFIAKTYGEYSELEKGCSKAFENGGYCIVHYSIDTGSKSDFYTMWRMSTVSMETTADTNKKYARTFYYFRFIQNLAKTKEKAAAKATELTGLPFFKASNLNDLSHDLINEYGVSFSIRSKKGRLYWQGEANQEFWSNWKSKKDQMKKEGYACSKFNNKFYVFRNFK